MNIQEAIEKVRQGENVDGIADALIESVSLEEQSLTKDPALVDLFLEIASHLGKRSAMALLQGRGKTAGKFAGALGGLALSAAGLRRLLKAYKKRYPNAGAGEEEYYDEEEM